jgi:DNA invertase Pin-like site-specific DNA recombinase
MAKIGYARVSTTDQNLDAQTDALTSASCERIFADTASGKLDRRPQLDQALDYIRAGDQLVVTKLDRLGRSLRHLLNLVADLQQRHIDLQVLDQGLDTSTPAGKLIFAVIGAVAEFERDLISERTRAGLDAARARGRKGGRRPVMTAQKAAVARQMYDSKQYTIDVIAKTVGVSRATLYRHLDAPTGERRQRRDPSLVDPRPVGIHRGDRHEGSHVPTHPDTPTEGGPGGAGLPQPRAGPQPQGAAWAAPAPCRADTRPDR